MNYKVQDMKSEVMSIFSNQRYFSENYIVACLDILGYSELVKNMTKEQNEKFIENFEREIFKIVDESVRALMKEKKNSKGLRKDFINKFQSNFRLRVFYDTLSVTLNISRFNSGDVWNAYLTYFSTLSRIILRTILKTRKLIRGGIAKGPYYENSKNGAYFNFSKAWVEAAELEKRANYPRIVVSGDVSQLFPKGNVIRELGFFNEDIDGLIYFNFYSPILNCFSPVDRKQGVVTKTMLGNNNALFDELVGKGYLNKDGRIKNTFWRITNVNDIKIKYRDKTKILKIFRNSGLLKVLADVKNIIEETFVNNRMLSRKVLSKWIYFSKYHNRILREKREGFFRYLRITPRT